MDISTYLETIQVWMIGTGTRLAVILILTLIGLNITRSASTRLFTLFTKGKDGTELKKRADTLSSVVRYVLMAMILAVAAMMSLKELGLDIGPILAGAGVVGLAVGFGAQSLVKDIISGFFILLEDQIRVGDVVQIADKSGLVEKVTLRMVILRDFAGTVHYIPNGQIAVVSNMTKSFSFYVFDVGVGYNEDIENVMEALRKIDEEVRAESEVKADILEPLEICGLDKFGDSAIIVKARVKTRPIKQWSVGREYNLRIKKRFDELGIEIPFPHVTLYMGEDKSGSAPPMHLALDNADKLKLATASESNGHGRKSASEAGKPA